LKVKWTFNVLLIQTWKENRNHCRSVYC